MRILLLTAVLIFTACIPASADDGWDLFDCIGPRLADIEACRADPAPVEEAAPAERRVSSEIIELEPDFEAAEPAPQFIPDLYPVPAAEPVAVVEGRG